MKTWIDAEKSVLLFRAYYIERTVTASDVALSIDMCFEGHHLSIARKKWCRCGMRSNPSYRTRKQRRSDRREFKRLRGRLEP